MPWFNEDGDRDGAQFVPGIESEDRDQNDDVMLLIAYLYRAPVIVT